MRLFAVGISHRTAPIELRECVDFARSGLEAALAALAARNVTREAVVLSTCNRAEIYAGAESDDAAESCGRFISEYHGVAWDALAPHVVIYRGPEAADHLFRRRAESMLGRIASEVLTEGERVLLGDSFGTSFEGSVLRDAWMDWVRADGVRIPVSITMSPIRGTDGEITGASAIVRDETDRAQAEAALGVSAKLLRSVIDGSPIGMGVAGADHRWLQANPALCSLLGIAVDEAIGRSALEMIHGDDQDTVRMLEDRLFYGPPTVRSIERRYVDHAGRVVLTNVSARLIREPLSDEPVALYTIEDITERRRAEERVHSTEERFRRAALAISAARDPDEVLRAVLESARETLRAEYAAVATYSDGDSTISRFEADGLDPDSMLRHVGRWPRGDEILKVGGPVRMGDLQKRPEFRDVPNGEAPIRSLLAVPIVHEGHGRAILYLANKLDTEEFSEGDEAIAVALATHAAVCLENARGNIRASELLRDLDRANLELTQASEAKSRFLASVAHELRTPLHAILVAGELVHESTPGQMPESQVRDLGATIESSGRHMVHLIDDLVDLSRIEAGRLDLRPTQVVLEHVIEEVKASLARTAENRGITLELPQGSRVIVLADPVRLRQILTNLIANALKFTEPGGRVWLEVQSGHASTRITVSDTGIGIAPEHVDRVFLPFEQVSGIGTSGAGLGLAISRSLAELHGGHLKVKSVPGAGSVFTLTLPGFGQVAAATPGPALIPHVAAIGRGRPILVVEDNPTALELASMVLRMADFEVWQARGLGEATDVLARATPALILLDLRLGDGNGLDLLSKVRTDASFHDIPVLVLSADAMPDDMTRAKAAGCSGFLSKPVSSAVLLSHVHELIKEADAAARRRARAGAIGISGQPTTLN